jgi:hypothetical protein
MKIKLKNIQQLIYISILIIAISCSKSSGSGSTPTPPPPTPVEENIAFTIDIDPGNNVFPALGATQDAKITLTSKMPTAGITLDVLVKSDLDNTTISSGSYSSSISPFTATITNLTPGALCNATFTIKSKTTLSNTAIKSFKIARK